MPKVQSKQEQSTFRSFIDLSSGIQANDDGSFLVPTEIQLLDCGEWDTMYHGKFKITTQTLDDMVKNFSDGVRKGVPIDEEHDTTGGADGWIEKVYRVGNKLMASVDWNNRGKKVLADKVFRFFSPEFSFDYPDPETGKTYKNVLLGGALTNRPLFKNLKPIMASDGTKPTILYLNENTMDIDALRAKPMEELTEEEKAFIAEADAAEVKATLEEPIAPVVEEPAAHVEEKKEKKSDEVIEASEADVSIKASELKALKDLALKASEYMATLRQKECSEKVEGWMFNDKGGKFPPTMKENLTDFVMGLNDMQAKNFDVLVEQVPNRNLFAEKGIQEKSVDQSVEVKAQVGLQGSAAKQIEEQTLKLIEESGMQYGRAYVKVCSENPELAKQAREENPEIAVSRR